MYICCCHMYNHCVYERLYILIIKSICIRHMHSNVTNYILNKCHSPVESCDNRLEFLKNTTDATDAFRGIIRVSFAILLY